METTTGIDRCAKCDAHCCRHVAVQIDTPKSKKDYNTVRWYLLHQNVWVSIDLDNHWILEFKTPCRYIEKDFKCGDYENRPEICRDYPGVNELCEGETKDVSYKYLFKSIEEYDIYLERRIKKISGMQKTRGKMVKAA